MMPLSHLSPIGRAAAVDHIRSLKCASMNVGSRQEPPIGLVETADLRCAQSRRCIAYHAAANRPLKLFAAFPLFHVHQTILGKLNLGTDFGKAPAGTNPYCA